jgi:hypothetical protein
MMEDMRIAIGALLVTVACGGSAGKLANKQRPLADMVKDRDILLIESGTDHVRIRVDGTDRATLWSRKYSIQDMTPSGSVVVLGDSDTNLYVASGLGAQPQRITALDGRAGSVKLRPDGAVIAATRHADFTQRQSQWHKSEDDAVYLIDVKTLAIDVIPKSREELVTSLWWYADGLSLFVETRTFDKLKLDLATRTRTKLDADPERSALHVPKLRDVCERTGEMLVPAGGAKGDKGIAIFQRSGATKPLVVIEGRSRGFHDYQSTIRRYAFTHSCEYVVFDYERAIWVVEVATGDVAKLMDGDGMRILD